MWLDIIFALYCVPAAVVLIAAAIHRADNSEEWYTLMWLWAILPIMNIYVVGCIVVWYIWKGYHKVFDKKFKFRK